MRIVTSFLIFIFPLVMFGKGAITGFVTDAKTKEPLRGVTVKIVGTYYGAISDAKGKYLIKNIAPGNAYTIDVSYLGFKKVLKTGIKVADNDTLKINFALVESDVIFGQDVVVLGAKPMVETEETQSIASISSQQIQQSGAEKISDVITQQSGVVEENKEIHIRGGRGYEAAVLLDGMSIQNPLSGTGFGLEINAGSIQEAEVITGGFNPEYGQATSGIINLRTKNGGDNIDGSASYKRMWKMYQRNPYDQDTNSTYLTDILEFSIGGPEPISRQILPALGIELPGKMTFFLNIYGNASDYLVPNKYRSAVHSSIAGDFFAPRNDNSFSGMGKITWTINSSMRLAYSYNESVTINQNSRSLQTNLEYVEASPGYQYNFQANTAGALSYGTISKIHQLVWTHTLNTSSLYEIRLSNFNSRLKNDANGLDYQYYREPKDIPGVPAQYYHTSDSTKLGIIPGDGFYDTGNGLNWNDLYINEWALRGDYTLYLSEKNKLKAGIDTHFQEMQSATIYEPWLGPLGLNNDIFNVNTINGAFYIQNNLSFKGLILNYGFRMDFWAPGKLVDNAVADTTIPTITSAQRQSYLSHTADFLGLHWKARLSPRLGVSHPISDNQMLFFSYGHFNKLPRPQFVYAKLEPQSANSSYQKFGNPDLNPETTIGYELGLKSQLTNDDVLTFTAYYKDIFDYIQTKQLVVNNPRLSGGSFVTYVNSDYARSRGIEAEYKKRIGSWFAGSINAAYSVVTGKSGSSDQGAQVVRGVADERITEDYMSWDRPVRITATTNFIFDKNSPLFGVSFLDDMNIFLRFFFQSGKRYTPEIPVIDQATGKQAVQLDGRPIYAANNANYLGAISDNWQWLDINIEKYVSWGTSKLVLNLEVLNLFDTKNSDIINPVTGRAYENGDPTPLSWNDQKYPQLQSPISPYPFNPARYLNRRTLRFGMSVKF